MLRDERAIRAPIDEKDEVSLAKFVLTRNFHRRQLSPGQWAMIFSRAPTSPSAAVPPKNGEMGGWVPIFTVGIRRRASVR
jgi:hypothetical protein